MHITYRNKDYVIVPVSKEVMMKLVVYIVVTCHNKNILTMPASSQYVIGVKADKKVS
ncbi:hypothetical protein [Clostridium beijerinckii]|uniref:hypothetical protein n=1 Tax=Clostridium beijerinckii TaxID=1520 RepID=UPI000A9C5E29|nr:hypothetical protein [Clostridium beijerinckii]